MLFFLHVTCTPPNVQLNTFVFVGPRGVVFIVTSSEVCGSYYSYREFSFIMILIVIVLYFPLLFYLTLLQFNCF